MTKRPFAFNRLGGDADQVDGLFFECRVDGVGQAAGEGVRFDFEAEEVEDFVIGNPAKFEMALVVVESHHAWSMRIDEDIDSGSDVVAVKGNFNADFASHFPAEFSGKFRGQTVLAIGIYSAENRSQHG